MKCLELIKITSLMSQTKGNSEIKIGLIDGNVLIHHPDFDGSNLRDLNNNSVKCRTIDSSSCIHGTFVAGILAANRNSLAPAICPECTLLIRPIFFENTGENEFSPSSTPGELSAAIIECINSGARIINLSLALAYNSIKKEKSLEEALNYATRRGTLIVAAAGNQGILGGSAITSHPWVIPVVA